MRARLVPVVLCQTGYSRLFQGITVLQASIAGPLLRIEAVEDVPLRGANNWVDESNTYVG